MLRNSGQLVYHISSLLCKLFLLLFFLMAWFGLAYIQYRVWSELPRHLERNAMDIMPVYGCTLCEGMPSQPVYICNNCTITVKDSTNASYSHAVRLTANMIARDHPFILSSSGPHTLLHTFVHHVAHSPSLVIQWMLGIPASVFTCLVVWIAYKACHSSYKQMRFRRNENTGMLVAEVFNRHHSPLPKRFQDFTSEYELSLETTDDENMYKKQL